jgi:hypothetical protein
LKNHDKEVHGGHHMERIDGWYVGPALEHYRCYKCYIPSTKNAIRIADTVEFFPAKVPFPQLLSADNAFRAATELIDTLKTPHPAQPFASIIGTSQTKALQQLADIFQQSLPQGISKPLTAPGTGVEVSPATSQGVPVQTPSTTGRVPTNQHQHIFQRCGLIR